MTKRVYWNGVFPDKTKQGTVVQRGLIRHLVLWDGKTKAVLEYAHFLKEVSKK